MTHHITAIPQGLRIEFDPSLALDLQGNDLWGGLPGRILVSTIAMPHLHQEMPYIDVYHDREWQIYTDRSFERHISAILSDILGLELEVFFTEQGMQQDGVASMETSSRQSMLIYDFFKKQLKKSKLKKGKP